MAWENASTPRTNNQLIHQRTLSFRCDLMNPSTPPNKNTNETRFVLGPNSSMVVLYMAGTYMNRGYFSHAHVRARSIRRAPRALEDMRALAEHLLRDFPDARYELSNWIPLTESLGRLARQVREPEEGDDVKNELSFLLSWLFTVASYWKLDLDGGWKSWVYKAKRKRYVVADSTAASPVPEPTTHPPPPHPDPSPGPCSSTGGT